MRKRRNPKKKYEISNRVWSRVCDVCLQSKYLILMKTAESKRKKNIFYLPTSWKFCKFCYTYIIESHWSPLYTPKHCTNIQQFFVREFTERCYSTDRLYKRLCLWAALIVRRSFEANVSWKNFFFNFFKKIFYLVLCVRESF